MNFAQKTLRALRNDGLHGVGHIFRAQDLQRVLCCAPREFRGDTSWANHTDADAEFAEIFAHAAGKTDNTPLGRAIDAAAGERVLAGERTDIDDVARAAADHGRRHRAGNEENTLEIGIEHAVPVGFGFLVGWSKETDAGVVDENGDGAQRRFCFGNQIGNFGWICCCAIAQPMPRLPPVTSATPPASGFFSRGRSFVLLIRAMRNLPRTGHSFCATLILSLEFSAALGIPCWPRGKKKDAAFFMKKFPQVMKSVRGNVLQIGCGLPYNPKVFRNNAIPGRSILGCTGSRKLRLGV